MDTKRIYQTKLSIISTLLVGFVTHTYIMTNNYPCWDALVSFISKQIIHFGEDHYQCILLC